MRRSCPLRAAVLVVASLVAAGTVAPVDASASIGVRAHTAAAPPAPPTTVDRADAEVMFRAVAVPGPCLVLDGPSTIDFGRGELGGPPLTSTSTTTARSCGVGTPAVAVFASVSATAAGGGSIWLPVGCAATPCSLAVDEFAYLLGTTSLVNRPVEVAVGQALQHTLQLPPPGSAGGGSRVTLRVQFLGVVR